MRNTAPKDAAEIEALETREWLESLDYVLQSGGPARVSRLLARAERSRPPERRQAAVHRQHPLHQHHSRQPNSRRSPAAARSSAASRAWSAGTRWRWWSRPTRPRTASAVTSRLRLGRHALRSRVQSLLQGQGRRPRRRHHLLPGTRGARHLRARVSRRPPARRRSSRTSAAS